MRFHLSIIFLLCVVPIVHPFSFGDVFDGIKDAVQSVFDYFHSALKEDPLKKCQYLANEVEYGSTPVGAPATVEFLYVFNKCHEVLGPNSLAIKSFWARFGNFVRALADLPFEESCC
ncbi:unnamed protein product [Caenorhabditis brenneri]